MNRLHGACGNLKLSRIDHPPILIDNAENENCTSARPVAGRGLRPIPRPTSFRKRPIPGALGNRGSRGKEDARIQPDEINYINPHGSSTPLNDSMETKAIKEVFGSHADKVAISSTKSMLGHAMGASGTIEAIACILAIRDGIVPPTINYEHPDPECDLDCVPNEAREATVQAALSNSLGFGGHNVCLAFRRMNCLPVSRSKIHSNGSYPIGMKRSYRP